jgi:hypothetical protein
VPPGVGLVKAKPVDIANELLVLSAVSVVDMARPEIPAAKLAVSEASVGAKEEFTLTVLDEVSVASVEAWENSFSIFSRRARLAVSSASVALMGHNWS